MTEKLNRPKGENNEYDFDLPEVEDGPKGVRVHEGPGGSTCTSCEG
jgi:hypothetical protein